MKRLPWFLVIVAALAIAAIAYAVWHYPSAGVVPAATGAEAWGQMGDYFGGILNPVLSFCALIALLYTIHQQHQELALTRRELEKTFEELEMSREAQERSAELLAKQTAMTVVPSVLGELSAKIRLLSANAGEGGFVETSMTHESSDDFIESEILRIREVAKVASRSQASARRGASCTALADAMTTFLEIRKAYNSNLSWITATLSRQID
ncbi:MAG: hypothetical protein II007_08675 [Gammaproteobacteria bacterium]|nr:hypothetical protein [Gammaproteobacteria bacterium]